MRKIATCIPLCLVCMFGVCCSAAVADDQRERGLQLEDPVKLLPPRERSESETNRIEALALFAAARMREQQQDYVAALRLYQRALRYDPQSMPILERIVPLAFRLRRPEEAVRYALRSMESKRANPRLMRVLADHLADSGDIEGALKLYQRVASLENAAQKKTAGHVLLVIVMGRLRHANNQHEKAADAFAEVLHALEHADDFGLKPDVRGALLGDASKTYTMFGESFLKAGRFEQAVSSFETAQQVDRDKNALAYQMARVHLAADKPDQALKQLQVYLQAGAVSQGKAPYRLLSEVLSKLGRRDELVDRLEAVRADDADNVFLAHFLAESYRDGKNDDKAATLYRSVIDKGGEKPDFAEMVQSSYTGLVNILRRQKKADALLDVLGDLAAASGGLDSLDQELEALTKDKPLAKALLKQAQEKHQAKALEYGGRLAAAIVALESEQFDEAGVFFSAAIEGRPKSTAEIIMMWGLGLMMADKNAEAADVFQRGIDDRALPPENPAFHYYLSGALELAGKTDEALKAARHAISVNESNPRIQSRVGWIYYHARKYDEAMKYYTSLVRKFDDVRTSNEVRRVVREARLVLSNICVIQDDIPQAEEWLEEVLDEFPENISALNDLGYLWADQGKNLLRALEMVKAAVAAEPDNTAYLDSLGWAYFRLGRFAEALEQLKKATEGDEPDAVILDHLGDALHAVGNIDAARKTWRRALKVFDVEQDAEKIKATKEKIKKAKTE